MSTNGLATYVREVTKHPNSERTFTLDLTDWLAGFGDSVTIDEVDWDTTGFTAVGSPDHDDTMASVKLSGGVVSLTRYPVVGMVTASNGEVQPFTFLILVAKP